MSSEISSNCSCKSELTLTHIKADKSASSFAGLPAGARYILIFFTPSPIRSTTRAINGVEGARYRAVPISSIRINFRTLCRNELSSWTCYFYVQPSEHASSIREELRDKMATRNYHSAFRRYVENLNGTVAA